METSVPIEKPLFSVVIPLFNRAHRISDTLRSVFAQTVSDFEVVIVDDGSTDNPRPAIESFEDHRIHYISQMNAGGGTARNRAIDEAKGEFIAFLDSDDRFLPGHLESMQRIVQGRCDVAAYAQVIVDRHIGATFLKPPRAIREFESMAEYLCCERGFVQTSALVVPAALARKVRYREGMPFGQDTDFAIRLSVAGCKFVMARQPGAIWNDAFDSNRVSSSRKGARLIPWIEDMRPFISAKAYHGYYGWHIAKSLAKTDKFEALRLYVVALANFCYSPALSAVILCQIFIPDEVYRRCSDRVLLLRRH